jgi:hypothetical protein
MLTAATAKAGTHRKDQALLFMRSSVDTAVFLPTVDRTGL